jgi:ABC-type bacteriocin/lantibiotic exporter with double-glycine peptidase domain
MPNQPITQLLMRLWRHISQRRRCQFGLLLVLMLAASFVEIFSIGAVLPFLGALTAPEKIFMHPLTQPVIQSLRLTEPAQLLLPLTVAFGLAALLAGAMRLLLLWATTRLSFAVGADLGFDIYRRTLYQPYAVHCARNSSEVINGILGKANGVLFSTILPTLTLISSCTMLITILIALLVVEPIIALSAFGGFGLIYAVIVRVTREQLSLNSQRIATETTSVVKSLQEGLGGIRDVLIDGSQATYCQIYRNADLISRRAQGDNHFISQSPRYVMEALGMILISMLAYTLAKQVDGVAKAIPILGAFALGAQRLLPVLQQAYAAWSGIRGGQVSLQDTLDLLDQPLPDHAHQPSATALSFMHSISLKQVSFRYNQQTPFVLNSLNLNIAKGSRIGFIGTTGSGKSTLLDIVMGLLYPSDGSLEVDGISVTPSNSRAWQVRIANVPQTVFLSDASIKENIAFGVPKDQIDLCRVRQAAEKAQLAGSIETWPEKYQTIVGERGIRLSGGQRQRIGIARALYKQADVIIFDEATSALDNETEQAVMQAIENLSQDITLLIIAHRVTTLKGCTQIVELSDGGIKRIGGYQDIINQPSHSGKSEQGQPLHAS